MSFTSKVVVYEGPRGSGKTLSMTYDLIRAMLSGCKVFCNYAIRFQLRYEGKLYTYESLPLNMDALYTFSEEMTDCVCGIDEVLLWADNRRYNALSTKLFNSIQTLIRKRRMSFYMTAQNYEWLDNRTRWQTDLLVICSDLYYRYREMEKGSMINQISRDMSGLLTGKPYDKYGFQNSRIFKGKPFWNCYNTDEEFDVIEAMTPLKLGTKARVIGYEDVEGAYDPNGCSRNPNAVIFKNVINDLVKQGYSEVSKMEIQKKAKEYGFNGNWYEGGTLLSNLGVTKANTKGTKYNLETAIVG